MKSKPIVLLAVLLFFSRITSVEYEYTEQLTTLLQTMWGKNFLTPGGSETVDAIIGDTLLKGKSILDFGCGLGGPSLYIAQKYQPAAIVGIDINPSLIMQAQELCAGQSLNKILSFKTIAAVVHLPFEDNSFDIIFCKESILHIEEKTALFAEFFRVLKKDGVLLLMDWFHSSAHYTSEMQRFVVIDGLTLHLVTFQQFATSLKNAGFTTISLQDTTDFSLQETTKDYNHLLETGGKEIAQQLNNPTILQECLESWGLQKYVLEKRELNTAIVRASK